MDDGIIFMVVSIDAIVLAFVDADVLVILHEEDFETWIKSDVMVYSLKFLIIVSTCFCCRN